VALVCVLACYGDSSWVPLLKAARIVVLLSWLQDETATGRSALKARTLAVAVDRRFKKSGGPGNFAGADEDQSGCRLDRIQGRPSVSRQRENSIPMRLPTAVRAPQSRARPPRKARHRLVAARSGAAHNRLESKSFGRPAARWGSGQRRPAEISRGADFRSGGTLRSPRGANRPWKDLPRQFH
jgi:hypothetical protein